MGTVYPVGSLYFGTQSTCPLAAIINGSTWEKVGSSLITSVNTSVPVKGNGTAIELKGVNNQDNIWLMTRGMHDYNANLNVCQADSKPKLNTSYSGSQYPTYENAGRWAVGLTTDSNNSGIVGTVTRTSLTVNIFKRTA